MEQDGTTAAETKDQGKEILFIHICIRLVQK